MAGVASARIGNRHALQPVYYSTDKKTAVSLTETDTRTPRDTTQRDCTIKIELSTRETDCPRKLLRTLQKFKKIR